MWGYVNRTVCDVLTEIRKLDETKNYAPLLSLVHEVQILANRMEAGLSDQKDIQALREERSKLKSEVNKLKQERDKTRNELGKSKKH